MTLSPEALAVVAWLCLVVLHVRRVHIHGWWKEAHDAGRPVPPRRGLVRDLRLWTRAQVTRRLSS